MFKPVHFVGAGPGADDLITMRGADLLARADVVIHAGSLVNPVLLNRCKPDCAIHDSAALDLAAQVALMAAGVQADKLVVRLHTGEPSVYGAIGEQMDALKRLGIECRVTPGVSSVFAAAAALECELTRPGLSQSVVLTRTPGRTPMPEGETAAAFARTGATLAFFLSVGKLDELAEELIHQGGMPPDTPAAVVYRASWPDEIVVQGTLATIGRMAREAGLKRQAIVLVGRALDPSLQGQTLASSLQGQTGAASSQHDETIPQTSQLYAKTFSHGYRNHLQNEAFSGRCALWAFTDKGLALARTLSTGLGLGLPCVVHVPAHRAVAGDTPFPAGEFEAAMAEHWAQYDAHIVIGATGIAVRGIAPHLQSKTQDPAVISCPDTGTFALPLVSGHLGGANRFARRVARITGGEALISTATDIHQLPAFDEAAAQEGAAVLNPKALRVCNAALLGENTNIDFIGPRAIFERYFAECGRIRHAIAPAADALAVFWITGAEPAPLLDTEADTDQTPARLYIRERTMVLGVGCRKNADPATLEIAVRDWFLRRGMDTSRLAAVATCTLKAAEPALIQLADALNVPLVTHAESVLEAVQTPTPSQRVAAKVGTPSVAEAAALLTAARLGPESMILAPKQSLDSMTLALATCAPHDICASHASTGTLTVVGLGSGSPRHITPEVRRTLHLCTHIAGYSGYVDLIRPLVAGKTLIETPMRGEVERCRDALDAARQGHPVCMVCSGDPGVLAMAGLIYELRDSEPRFAAVPVAVFPGITAANLAAAALGAPLQNGFSLISLSDLLVPADEVRRNVAAAAESALPLVLYNPAGRKRRALLEESLNLLLHKRGPQTPAAMVREAGRPNEQKWIGQLLNLPRERVDMSTLIVVGGPRTRLSQGVLFEERGYADARP